MVFFGDNIHITHFTTFKWFYYPTAIKGCQGVVFTHGVQMDKRRETDSPGCMSETVRCRKLILGSDIG